MKNKILLLMLSIFLIIPFVSGGQNPYIKSDNYFNSYNQNFIVVGGLDRYTGNFIKGEIETYFIYPYSNSSYIIKNSTFGDKLIINLPYFNIYNHNSNHEINLQATEGNIFISFFVSNSTGTYFIKDRYDENLNTISARQEYKLLGSPNYYDISCKNLLCAWQTSGTQNKGVYGYITNLATGEIQNYTITSVTQFNHTINATYKPLIDKNDYVWFFQERNETSLYFLKIYDINTQSLKYSIDLPESTNTNTSEKNFIMSHITNGVYNVTIRGLDYYIISTYFNQFPIADHNIFNYMINQNYQLINSVNTGTSSPVYAKSGLSFDYVKEYFIQDIDAQRKIYDINLNLLNTSTLNYTTFNIQYGLTYFSKFTNITDLNNYGYNMLSSGFLFQGKNGIPIINLGNTFRMSRFYQIGNTIYLAFYNNAIIQFFVYGQTTAGNNLPIVSYVWNQQGSIYTNNFNRFDISSTDAENDTMIYAFNCDYQNNKNLYPTFSYNPYFYCLWDSGGDKTIRVYVSDSVHGSADFRSYKDINLIVLKNLTTSATNCNFYEDFKYIDSIKNHGWNYNENILITPSPELDLVLSNQYEIFRDVTCDAEILNLSFQVSNYPAFLEYGLIFKMTNANGDANFMVFHDNTKNINYNSGNIITTSLANFNQTLFVINIDINIPLNSYSIRYRNATTSAIYSVINKTFYSSFFLNPIIKKVYINSLGNQTLRLDWVKLESSGGLLFFDQNFNISNENLTTYNSVTGQYEIGGFIFEQGLKHGYTPKNFNYTKCDIKGYKYNTCPLQLIRDSILSSTTGFIINNFLIFTIFILLMILAVYIMWRR